LLITSSTSFEQIAGEPEGLPSGSAGRFERPAGFAKNLKRTLAWRHLDFLGQTSQVYENL
jgi:hypothetical protein